MIASKPVLPIPVNPACTPFILKPLAAFNLPRLLKPDVSCPAGIPMDAMSLTLCKFLSAYLGKVGMLGKFFTPGTKFLTKLAPPITESV